MPPVPYHQRFPAKYAARKAVQRALYRGELVRQPCEVCGAAEVHAHHPDYAKPFSVLWLCRMHHQEWHRENGPGRNGGDGELLLAPGGEDLRGRRFGSLVALYATSRRAGRSIVWQCACDCGMTCLRRATALASVAKSGGASACRGCLGASAAQRSLARGRRVSVEGWTKQMRNGGTLWSPNNLDSMEDKIRDEIAERLGVRVSFTLESLGSLHTSGLYSGHDFDDDSGVDSLDGMTLAEIAAIEGVTRERIRQIEEKALKKLRAAARVMTATDRLRGLGHEFTEPRRRQANKTKPQRKAA